MALRPPSELSILQQFLLAPAQLPAAISLSDFAALFPKPLQSSPQVRTLYRDLQHQRNAVVDAIAADIEAEVAHGAVLHRNVVNSRIRAEAQEDTAADDELLIEQFLGKGNGGNGHSNSNNNSHSLISIVTELEDAVHDLEAELQSLADEEIRLRQMVRQTVHSMSDLRYGRLANPQLREDILEGLQSVQEACKTTLERQTNQTST